MKPRYAQEFELSGTKNPRGSFTKYARSSLPARTYRALITARLSQKQLLGRHPMPPILANINHNLINLLPAMA